ncbi:PAS domain-containing protein [Halopelagius inordinatus]|uniref:PAS domain-containing protein n=1 Tax=Halopelagius inordinatus TaxID=553467 RepID=A0A1I2VD50_9EURY|nr:histidine kinase N-terminal 7TM domain-containing protein [Halopelagius inordinatus]SFG87275.1 PAS domain-containing protein [Halopelagius inordinatus]
MSWQFTPLALPTVGAMIITVVLGGYTLWKIRTESATSLLKSFLLVNVCLVIWTFFSTLKLLHTNPAMKLFFYRLLYFGVAPLGSFALLFVLINTDREDEIRASVLAVLLLVPAVFLLVLFTNPYSLAFESTRVVERGGLVILRVDTGVAHVVLELVYNALVSALAVGLMLSEALRLGRSYLPQALLVTGGIAAPFVFVGLSFVAVPPFTSESINLIPTSAGVTSLALGVAIARYHFLNLPPIAYSTAMEASPDSVLVLDAEKRIIHANERGIELLEQLDISLGDIVTDGHPSLDVEADPEEVVRVDLDGPVYLSVRSQSLERQGYHVGWVVVLRDVTELHEHQQTIVDRNDKLRLLNEILRHDIRNDMMVVLGNARLAQERADDEVTIERLETIVRNSEHASELTDSVRVLMSTMLSDKSATESVRLGSVLTEEVNTLRAGDCSVNIDEPEALSEVQVVANDLLGAVFRNLLTNAVQHNHDESTEIEIAVTRDETDVCVRVSDNGPGIPDERKEDVFGRGEKGLESSGTGLGLYLIDTVVDSYGGDVWIEDNEPTGTTFVVRLRRARVE